MIKKDLLRQLLGPLIVQTVVSPTSSGCHSGLDNVRLPQVGSLTPPQDLDVVSRHQTRGALTGCQEPPPHPEIEFNLKPEMSLKMSLPGLEVFGRQPDVGPGLNAELPLALLGEGVQHAGLVVLALPAHPVRLALD